MPFQSHLLDSFFIGPPSPFAPSDKGIHAFRQQDLASVSEKFEPSSWFSLPALPKSPLVKVSFSFPLYPFLPPSVVFIISLFHLNQRRPFDCISLFPMTLMGLVLSPFVSPPLFIPLEASFVIEISNVVPFVLVPISPHPKMTLLNF